MLSLYNRTFKVSPARRLRQHLLSRFVVVGVTVPGTLPDRVVSMGESPTKRAFNFQYNIYPKLVCQTMMGLLTQFYLLII